MNKPNRHYNAKLRDKAPVKQEQSEDGTSKRRRFIPIPRASPKALPARIKQQQRDKQRLADEYRRRAAQAIGKDRE